MPVLSAVADGDRPSSPTRDDPPGDTAPVTPADLDDPSRLRGPSTGVIVEPDEVRDDPATTIVDIGEVPPIRRPRPARRRILPPPPTDRLRGWVVTLVLTTVAAVVRLVDLGAKTDGGTPLFDEKYYAIQAWEMLRNGGIEDNQAYGVVVHPPLGKQLIAIGEALFGYTPFGWRFASAVAGVLCVLIMVRVARRMTGSTLLGGIAGVLLICDGVSHVMARTALLDVFQALFVLAAFACVIADRDQVRRRLHDSLEQLGDATGRGSWAGVALGARWWRFGAGVFLGLATGIKWSGAYWVVAFLVLVFIWDVCARREIGVRRPLRAALRRDLLPTIWSLGIIPLVTYVGSWWAWFASETAWARHILVASAANRNDWKSGTLYELGSLWQNSLWQWTWKMLDFHSHLLTPTDPAQRHPWESKPWTWPLSTRPVLFYSPANGTGCGEGRTDCVSRIFLVGTPALWWVSLFVLVWALWKAVGRLDWRYAAVLVGYGAGYLPWFTNLDRQMYFFYATPLAPFLVLGIVLVLGDILGPARQPAGPVGIERRLLSIAVVAIYVGLVVANFIWLWPILVGSPITPERLTMETWLPSWG